MCFFSGRICACLFYRRQQQPAMVIKFSFSSYQFSCSRICLKLATRKDGICNLLVKLACPRRIFFTLSKPSKLAACHCCCVITKVTPASDKEITHYFNACLYAQDIVWTNFVKLGNRRGSILSLV